jgi:membrane protein
MRERGFLTGFVLPVAAAFAVAAVTQPRRGAFASLTDRSTTRGASSGGSPRDPGRGRAARKPSHIPARGWRDILWRVWSEMGKDNLSIVSAGIAFYAMLSLFPALAAALSLYGLIADPVTVERQLAELAGLLPEGARTIITDQLSAIARQPRSSLSFGAILGIAFALWSASAAIRTLMDALNVVYDEKERRSFVRFYATALGLTLGGIVWIIVAISLVAALPAALNLIGLPAGLETALRYLRWPLLAIAVMAGLAALYRYGPSREQPQWRWVSWGAVVATLLWLVASAGFSYYVSNFGSYNETYGALGAVIVLLMWLYITAYIVLIGGELNAEMEHQTAEDTTDRGGAPLGARGAYVADTVGAVP